MTAKQYLRQYIDCDDRIKSKIRHIKRLEERVTGASFSFGGKVNTSLNNDSVARIIESYVDMQKELECDVIKLKETQKKVISIINSIENNIQKSVLERYYIENLTFEQVAVDINYSYRQICRIHGMALQEVTKILGAGDESA